MKKSQTLLQKLTNKYKFKAKLASECTEEEIIGRSITMAFKPTKEIIKIRTTRY